MPSTTASPAIEPPKARLKLSMPSPTHSANLDALAVSQDFVHPQSRRPSYSPVTPPFPGATSDAIARRGIQPEFIDEPDLIPVNLDDNSDAIALKAALSILQLQKQQSKRDIKQLDRMKATAIKEPQAFIDALQAGKLTKMPAKAFVDVDGDEEEVSGDERLVPGAANSERSDHTLGQFPHPQNVVRCPPINWAKYHVVGESLDRLHDEQRRRPEPGNPRRDEFGRPLEHVVAAPYRPLVDTLEQVPNITRRESQE